MSTETSGLSEKRQKFAFSPIFADFIYAIEKVKSLTGVLKVYLFPTNGKDCINLYIVVKQESIELNNKIFQYFIDWQEDYMEFLETHILNENETHYVPKGAHSIE